VQQGALGPLGWRLLFSQGHGSEHAHGGRQQHETANDAHGPDGRNDDAERNDDDAHESNDDDDEPDDATAADDDGSAGGDQSAMLGQQMGGDQSAMMGQMMMPMAADPSMLMQQMGNPAMMGADASGADLSQVGQPAAAKAHVDPRIRNLCREFGVNDQVEALLHESMLTREDYDDDIQALRLLMERDIGKNKKPHEAMRTHVRSLKSGRFPGKAILNKDLWNFATRFDLDDRVLGKLVNTLNSRPDTMKEDLSSLDERMGHVANPVGLGLLVRLLEGLEETGRLPSPPRRYGGSGKFQPTPRELKAKGQGRDKSRDREERKRSRSREPQRYSDRRRSRSRNRDKDSRGNGGRGWGGKDDD